MMKAINRAQVTQKPSVSSEPPAKIEAMSARFDMRRRSLRADLHQRRVMDKDNSVERLMADAFTLDETLRGEFGALKRDSGWCYLGNGGRNAAAIEAKRLKASGVYDGLGGVSK